MQTKKCNKCHTDKDVGQFYPWNRAKDGLSSWCKSCHRDYQRRLRQAGAVMMRNATSQAAGTSGRYQSASEVVRAALRLLAEREQERAARIERLRQEIQKGLDSGPATPMTTQDWEELKRRARERAAQPNGQ